MTKYVLFSIDDENDPEAVDHFREYWDECGTSGNLVDMIGAYNGQRENSFLVKTKDFNKFVLTTDWIENQESVLLVSECNKMYATLVYLKTGSRVGLGSMHEVSEEEAMASDSWTYSPVRDIFWVAKKGNPDRVPSQETEEEFKPGFFARHWAEIFLCIFLTLWGMFMATSAEGQAAPQGPPPAIGYHMLDEQPDGAVMSIYLLNRLTLGHPEYQDVYLNTPYGLFVMEHNTTPNDECGLGLGCPDSLTLVDWPEGFGADALTINVDEMDAGQIRIYEWHGT